MVDYGTELFEGYQVIMHDYGAYVHRAKTINEWTENQSILVREANSPTHYRNMNIIKNVCANVKAVIYAEPIPTIMGAQKEVHVMKSTMKKFETS